jgi:hypothetical protein
MEERYTIYDLETLANCFTAYFMDWTTKKEKYFVISPFQNDFFEMMKFLRKLKDHYYILVGFNCNGFDCQILEYMMFNFKKLRSWSGEDIARRLHEKAQWIIGLEEGEEKWMNLIPEWKFTIPHIDIYKQKHYDGMGKRCSLKWLEFTMRFPNIESMPIHHSEEITSQEQVTQIVIYDANDVHATHRLFELNKFETDLRFKLSEKYELNLMNASEPRMARDIFGKFLSEAMRIRYKDLKEKRTYRSRIATIDVLFDYIKFRDPILNAVKKFYEDLEFNPYKFEENNMQLKKVKKEFKFHNLQEVVTGLGGIHGCTKPGVYNSTETWKIKDIDVTSFYPNLGIKNRLYPEHLSEVFCDVYENLFKMRQEIPKEDPENLVFKIILNATYGLSKEPNNYLHDPKYTFAITVNGQLLLLMLAEVLSIKVKGVVFYQINTDGVTIGYPVEQEQNVKDCMKKWEVYTKLALEDKMYKKIVIMDVNNYLAVDEKGKVKRKGLFAYSMKPEDKELEYHKNPSFLVIPKALEAFYVNNVPIQDYIKSCKDIYDFCGGVKVKKDFNLVEHYVDFETNTIEKDIINETVVRYYVSKEFKSLKKQYKMEAKLAGRTVEIEKGWNTTYFNIFQDKPMEEYNINYKYYTQSCRKIIDAIDPHSQNLKLF